jgi:hypothetical protein
MVAAALGAALLLELTDVPGDGRRPPAVVLALLGGEACGTEIVL